MRLLQRHRWGKATRTDNYINNIPCYAILSHTWGPDDDEVSFDDFTKGHHKNKAGYRKIEFCRRQVKLDSIQYFWIDTCCIDKANHTELSEAIASMYRWYSNAEKCYVYLADVPTRNDASHDSQRAWEVVFCRSRWFTRGWTLQELLAPRVVEFFSQEGFCLGDKKSLEHLIHKATTIPVEALRGAPLANFTIEQRMSWASQRQTTRKEDEAYCLQGIFNVFIPLIYGEEENAFKRLEKAIDERWATEQEITAKPKNHRMDDRPSVSVQAPEEQDSCLQSLAFPEMRNRRLNIEPRHRHTCEWILRTIEYFHWRLMSHGLLWIKGKPGVGKSTVMSFIYDKLKKEAELDPEERFRIRLEHFFSARGTELQRTFQGMLRSLLHQLCLQYRPTLEMVCTVFSDKKRSFGSSPNSWEWQLSELRLLLSQAVVAASRHRSLIIFVDALDEAGEQSARQIAQYFHQIQEQAEVGVMMCISCRHYPIVTSRKISLEVVVEQHNKDDIAAFIHDTLCFDEVIKNNPAEREIWRNLEYELNKRAQGSFQWAHLVVPIVQRRIDKGESPKWIREKVQDVPDELRDVYVHIIQHVIDREDRPLSFMLFQWVCLAARPLTITEVRHALTIKDSHPDNGRSSHVNVHDMINTDDRMKSCVTPLSGGLLEVVRGRYDTEESVQVGHQSVNDFMLTGGLVMLASISANTVAISSPRAAIADSPDFIPRCQSKLYWACLKHLEGNGTLVENLSSGMLDVVNKNYPDQKLPFVKYATFNVFLHAQKAGLHRTEDLAEEIEILQRVRPQWINSYRVLRGWHSDCPAENTQVLHIAARANMTDLVERLLQGDCNVDEKNDKGHTPLHLAARYGHQDSIVLLTDAGADIDVLDNDRRTALVLATGGGHFLSAQWLLNHGAGRASNALFQAVSSGHIELVKLFINAEADLNAQDGHGSTVLHIASYEGHEVIAQMLLANGADVNRRGGRFSTALQAASFAGHEKIVQILLNAGADVHTQAGEYGNALQAASAGGRERFGKHLVIVDLLLDAGADVNSQQGHRGTALQAASAVGDIWTMRFLLTRGAKVNAQAGRCGNALQAASLQGRSEAVRLLLEEGAEVNTQGGCHGTALQAASYNGHTDIVRLLLDAGADLNIQGGFCGNALRAAAVRGHEAVLSILVPISSLQDEIGDRRPYMASKHLY